MRNSSPLASVVAVYNTAGSEERAAEAIAWELERIADYLGVGATTDDGDEAAAIPAWINGGDVATRFVATPEERELLLSEQNARRAAGYIMLAALIGSLMTGVVLFWVIG